MIILINFWRLRGLRCKYNTQAAILGESSYTFMVTPGNASDFHGDDIRTSPLGLCHGQKKSNPCDMHPETSPLKRHTVQKKRLYPWLHSVPCRKGIPPIPAICNLPFPSKVGCGEEDIQEETLVKVIGKEHGITIILRFNCKTIDNLPSAKPYHLTCYRTSVQ